MISVFSMTFTWLHENHFFSQSQRCDVSRYSGFSTPMYTRFTFPQNVNRKRTEQVTETQHEEWYIQRKNFKKPTAQSLSWILLKKVSFQKNLKKQFFHLSLSSLSLCLTWGYSSVLWLVYHKLQATKILVKPSFIALMKKIKAKFLFMLG